MADDEDLIESVASGADVHDADEVMKQICALHTTWTPGEALDLGEISWNPSLMDAKRRWALHVHLSDEMPRHVERRLRAAASKGYQVFVALPLTALYDATLLRLLAEIDAYTYVIVSGAVERDRRHFLAAIADLDVAVDADTRIAIGQATMARLAVGTPFQRGRRLEALLAFLLSQIATFRIFERNYRNDTQEIDVIVQVTSYVGRCWENPGVPFILVEAKNTADKSGQPVVSLLIQKLRTKRGAVRLGLLFSISGFTADANHEELRLSETEYCVAMFDGSSIGALIQAPDLDKSLEEHIARALLR